MTGRDRNALQWTKAAKFFGIAVCVFALVSSATLLRGAEHDGRWAILVAGISGDPELQTEFLNQLRELRSALEGPLQFPPDHVVLLSDDPAKGPGIVQLQSTRENLRRACGDVARRAARDDLVFAFLLGHASFDGMTYKYNLVGPDPSAEDLAEMFYSIPAGRFVIVNTTPCSGASISAFGGKGRIVIAATKSGMEKNRTHFGPFFVEALLDNNADADKNGRVSFLEAFEYASRKVKEYYLKEGSLQTENPVLDDNGDGQAHTAPGPENGDGVIARTTFLFTGSSPLARGSLSLEQQQLLQEAQSLEGQIEALKYSKEDMPEAEYEKTLEELLLRLARIHAKLPKN
jgi:hypothetical protein